jgi:DNA-binding CsgD family transcriptional regulator
VRIAYAIGVRLLTKTNKKECLYKMPSPRQKEVLKWVAEGKTAWEIAAILGISQRTVEWHLNSVRLKVGAANITHAIAKLIRIGLIGAIGLGASGVGIYVALQIPYRLGYHKGLLLNVLFGVIT